MSKLAQASITDEVNGTRVIDFTEDAMVGHVTRECIKTVDPEESNDIEKIKAECIEAVNAYVDLHNAQPRCSKWKKLSKLTPQQIAILVLHMEEVRMINMGGKENAMQLDHMLLGIYQRDGQPNEGIYTNEQKDLPNNYAALSRFCRIFAAKVFLHTGRRSSNNCTFCPMSLEILTLFSFDVLSIMESILCWKIAKSS